DRSRTHWLSLEPAVLSEATDLMDRKRACGGACSTSSTKYPREDRPDEDPADRVTAGVGCRRRAAAGRGEDVDARPRCAGGHAPPDAVDGGGEGVPLRRPGGPGEPSRPV